MAVKKWGRRSVLRMGGILMAASASGGDVWAAQEPSLPEKWPAHPRLLVRKDDWATLARNRKTDADLDAITAGIVERARKRLGDAPLERKLEGRRLLSVSRDLITRVLLAAFAYRVTGEKAFLERAEKDMLAVAAFSDWNPSHFLDVAEMTTGVAIGYDWLFDDLSPETKATLRSAIVEKGLKPGADPAKNGWYRGHNNWNQVCLGGMAMGSIVVAEQEPELARRILLQVPTYNKNGLEPYRPDGIYPEGPGYWSYGTTYQVLLIEALKTAIGTDWGLTEAPGLLKSADFMMHVTGPSSRYFNFADGGDRMDVTPALFWMARQRRLPRLIALPERVLAERLKSGGGLDRFLPLIPFWRPSADERRGAPEPPLWWSGQGANAQAMWRTSWTDPDALYFAIKGGGAAVNHGHMDAGSFVLESDGIRWAVDLGAQSYNSLEKIGFKLWDSQQNADRWRVFRLNNFSHNTLTIDGQLHNAKGLAKLLEAGPNGATIDLVPALLPGQAKRAQRRVRIENGAVIVEDELEGLKPGADVRWAMATDAQLAIDGAHARLTKSGKALDVRFEPAALRVENVSIEKPEGDWNVANPGVRLLAAHGVADADGKLRITTRISRG